MADAQKAAPKKAAPKKAEEVKTLSQLQEELVALRVAQVESKKSHRAGDLVNPRVLTAQRKQIARTMTAITVATRESQKEEK